MHETSLKRVTVRGLHQRDNMTVELNPGLTILYGPNGSGKTTFLHILANLADKDIARFCRLRFDEITVTTWSEQRISLYREHIGEVPSVRLEINGQDLARITQESGTPEPIARQLAALIGGTPVYLPAFRSILEAISPANARLQIASGSHQDMEVRRIAEEETRRGAEAGRARTSYRFRDEAQGIAYKTVLCRRWFGEFVPTVRFPSLGEVAEQIVDEVQMAQFEVAATDRQAFSDVFVSVLRASLTDGPAEDADNVEALLGGIRENLEALQSATSQASSVYNLISSLVREQTAGPTQRETVVTRILRVYDEALRARLAAQRRAFERIETFEASVNRFLRSKQLTTTGILEHSTGRSRHPQTRLIQLQDSRLTGLNVLSSGERHVLTILFSATHMSASEGMLLIDEPELSLHVDWQRMILGELIKQAGDRQVIACTHAPEVTAEHRNSMQRLISSQLRQFEVFEDEDAVDETL